MREGQKTAKAKALRVEQPDAERVLWQRLRGRQLTGAKFRRQHPIGPYIADFACLECGLVFELDGGQHADTIEYDQRRADFISQHGFRVIRFWNNDVLSKTEAVLEAILNALNRPHPNPLPHAGEGIDRVNLIKTQTVRVK
jgi:very-short-patch-repair endonuclease